MSSAILLPTTPINSSSPSSVSPTANVGLSLGSGQPTETPPLTPAKSRTSLLAKLSTPPTARSSLSEMVARASKVRSILGQIQKQAPATSSMIPVDQSPASPPPPPPIVPSCGQGKGNRVDDPDDVDDNQGTLSDLILREMRSTSRFDRPSLAHPLQSSNQATVDDWASQPTNQAKADDQVPQSPEHASPSTA
ncbi:hypothetical protein LWI28_010228 [Acer negundo]|uniref:Uncharacterized protein n=1 Tax=Acer negundo TaxID=4023 RepID=A0AAD5NNA7_ACENE|nr:hypothetical protein LWI28_010228 [Acer negundo]